MQNREEELGGEDCGRMSAEGRRVGILDEPEGFCLFSCSGQSWTL